MNYMQAIGCDAEIEITQEKFIKACNADMGLNEIYAIEIKFDFVVENYFELQKIILEKTLSNKMFGSMFYESYFSIFFNNDRVINRVLFNFLSTAKLYVDQLKTSVNKINKSFSTGIEKLISEFTNCDINRFVIEIRNFMQHDGIVCSLSSGTQGIDSKHNSEHVCFYYQTMKLNEAKFSKKYQKDYSQLKMNNEINVLNIVSKFCCNICELHEKVRKLIKNEKDSMEDFIDTLYSLYKEKTGFDFSFSQELLKFYNSDSENFIFTTNIMKFISELENKNKLQNSMSNVMICNASKNQLDDL